MKRKFIDTRLDVRSGLDGIVLMSPVLWHIIQLMYLRYDISNNVYST